MATVMMRCATGTIRLSVTTASASWECETHVITWAHYDTVEEAQRVANDLNTGGARGTHAWVQE